MSEQSSCPQSHDLPALLAGTLDTAAEGPLVEHLDHCPTCQETLQQLAAAPEFHSQLVLHLREHGEDLPTLPLCQQLGRYEIRGEIGRGGMGVVYEAWDTSLDRPVAIKRLAGASVADPVARARFLRESRAAAAIASRFVVMIHTVAEADGAPYLVMEHVRGVSLQQRLVQEGPLPVEEIRRVGMCVAAGLAAAHERGVVHRDVKPGNILLADDGQVKITDFGLARAAHDVRLTTSGMLIGTPAYLAPEQVTGGHADFRADLFSLGSVLYAMCTGKAPFTGATPLDVARQVAETPPPPIAERNRSIPPWLVHLVSQLHAKDPGQRLASAHDVLRRLQQGEAVEQPPPAADRAAPAAPGRRKWPVWTGIVAAAALLAVFAGWALSRPAPESSDGASLPTPLDSTGTDDESESYVLLADGAGNQERFVHLAKALLVAADHSTLTLYGHGPFTMGQFALHDKSLTIRAAPGRVPVVRLEWDGTPQPHLLFSDSPLEIEGVELQAAGVEGSAQLERPALLCYSGPQLRLRRCRLVARDCCCLRGLNATVCELRDCELHGGLGAAVHWRDELETPLAVAPPRQLSLHNCICSGRVAVAVDFPLLQPLAVNLRRNTLATREGCRVTQIARPRDVPPGNPARLAVHAEGNVFDNEYLLVHRPLRGERPANKIAPGQDDAKRITRMLGWSGSHNAYPREIAAFVAVLPPWNDRMLIPAGVPVSIREWVALWQEQESQPVMTRINYAGGDRLPERAARNPHLVSTNAFRISLAGPAAAGMQAGADVDTLGPESPGSIEER